MLHLLRVYGKSLESSQWPPVHRPLLAAEYSRRKKNVWYQGAALLIQRRGIKNSQAKIPGSLEYSGWRRIRTALAYDRKIPERICSGVVVDGEGFEPSKASPADLQSVPFGHSGIHPFFAFQQKADDRTRTDNLLITNQLLCQLSHIGILN